MHPHLPNLHLKELSGDNPIDLIECISYALDAGWIVATTTLHEGGPEGRDPSKKPFIATIIYDPIHPEEGGYLIPESVVHLMSESGRFTFTHSHPPTHH
jgi:hypothetical protein